MKRYLQFVILSVFLIYGPFVCKEALAADPAMTAAEMQATIKAQAAEIVQLKRERDRLKSNVDLGWATIEKQKKEEDELKKIVLNLEKELRNCRGANR